MTQPKMKTAEEVAEEFIYKGYAVRELNSWLTDPACVARGISVLILAERTRLAHTEAPYETIYVPGHHQCPKCHFYLQKSILHPNGMSADRSMPENCPNDGTEMLPVTWKQNAQDGRAGQDRLMEIINEKDTRLAAYEKVAKMTRKVLDCLCEFCEKNCSGGAACHEYTEALEDALSALEAGGKS